MNKAEPTYIKNIEVYKEGSDGFVIYIVLADKDGAMTTADGRLGVSISEAEHGFSMDGLTEKLKELHSFHMDIKQSQFQNIIVGEGGPFERSLTMLYLGRFPYSALSSVPKQMTGKVSVDFRTKAGNYLKGDETILF